MDNILEPWLMRQLSEGKALEAQSDLFDLVPTDNSPAPQRYVVCYHCTGLVRAANGQIEAARGELLAADHVGLHAFQRHLGALDLMRAAQRRDHAQARAEARQRGSCPRGSAPRGSGPRAGSF